MSEFFDYSVKPNIQSNPTGRYSWMKILANQNDNGIGSGDPTGTALNLYGDLNLNGYNVINSPASASNVYYFAWSSNETVTHITALDTPIIINDGLDLSGVNLRGKSATSDGLIGFGSSGPIYVGTDPNSKIEITASLTFAIGTGLLGGIFPDLQVSFEVDTAPNTEVELASGSVSSDTGSTVTIFYKTIVANWPLGGYIGRFRVAQSNIAFAPNTIICVDATMQAQILQSSLVVNTTP